MLDVKLRRLLRLILVAGLLLGFLPTAPGQVSPVLAAGPLTLLYPPENWQVSSPQEFILADSNGSGTLVLAVNQVSLMADAAHTAIPVQFYRETSNSGTQLHIVAYFDSSGQVPLYGSYTFSLRFLDNSSTTFAFELSPPPCIPLPDTGCDAVHYHSR
jgi:hypothetical protein